MSTKKLLFSWSQWHNSHCVCLYKYFRTTKPLVGSWVSPCEIIICATSVLYTMKLERLQPVQLFCLLLINLTKPSWMVFIISAGKRSQKMPQWGFSGGCWQCPFHTVSVWLHFFAVQVENTSFIIAEGRGWRGKEGGVNKPGIESRTKKQKANKTHFYFNDKP